MKWTDVANTVGRVAPALGGVLAGPGGAAIGALAARALGADPTPEALAQAIHTNPDAAIKLAELEAEARRSMIEAQAKVVTAEVQGESWLQRNWRPLIMLWFSLLVAGYWFGLTPPNLSEDAVLSLFDIIQYGLSGYIIGRSAEKITRTVTGTGVAATFMDRIKR